jgi:integrase
MGAAETAELIPSNPVRKTRFPRRGPVREKAVIAPEKIRELLNALPEPSRSLAWLLVFTGLRIGELLALRWRNVDLEHGVLRVMQTVYEGHFDEPKTQRSKRSVPLGAKSIEILAARKPADVNPEALAFATRTGTPFERHNLVNKQLKPTCKRLGLVGVSWHWLRHANATLLDAVLDECSDCGPEAAPSPATLSSLSDTLLDDESDCVELANDHAHEVSRFHLPTWI